MGRMHSRKRRAGRLIGQSQTAKRVFRNPVAKSVGAGVLARARLRRRNAVTMGFLGIERKFYDTSLTGTAVAANANLTAGEYDPSASSMISTPAVGDSEQNREGKRINILSVQLNGSVQTSTIELGGAPGAGVKVFVALVLDTQSNGAQMNSEDCFKNTSAATATNFSPVRNLLFSNRFRVLKSAVLDLTPNTLSHFAVDSFSYGAKIAPFDWFLRFPKGLPVNFNAGTTADIANVIDNSLHVIAFTNNTQGTPSITYNARIRFVG